MINKITVLGLGAIGSNLLVAIAKMFPDLQYEGLDFDKVEPRNIGPQAYFLEHVNLPKAKALQVILARFNRRPKYQGRVEKLTKQLTPAAGELVLDCFDNTASRRLTVGAGEVFHVGFSPFYTAEALWSPGYEPAGDVPDNAPDICTVPGATAFIHLTVNAAALAVADYLLNGRKSGFIISGTLGSPKLRYL